MLCHSFLLLLFLVSIWIQSIHATAPTPLTQAQKSAWLNDHNVVRCQANAVTMPALIWDDALEKTAQEYVNTCPTGHNGNRQTRFEYFSGLTNTPGVGENYAAGYSTPILADGAWASEKSSNGGHYTQMVWADTTNVGCALNTVDCGSGLGKYYICDYYPPGNYVGESAFVSGGSANTEACQQQSRTDFPVMVYTNGVGTVVNGINGISGAPTIGPTTQGSTTTIPPTTILPTTPPTTKTPTTRAPTTITPTTPATTAPTTRAPTTAAPTSGGVTTSPTNPTSNPTQPTPTPTTGPTQSNGSLFPGTPTPTPSTTPYIDSSSQAGSSSNSASTSSGNNLGMIVGIVVGVILGLILLSVVGYYLHHRRSSITWMTSKAHMKEIQQDMDVNRYNRGKAKNQLSAEPSRAPSPLTSIATTSSVPPTTTSYNPGQVFNPPSFANNHRKQDSMDDYTINPVALATGTPVINKPVIPSSPPTIPTSRPQATPPVPVVPNSPPVPTSRPTPQMSPKSINRTVGGGQAAGPPQHRYGAQGAW